MSKELKPCPFCGMPVDLRNGLTHYVKHKESCFFGMDRREESLEERTEAWNRRSVKTNTGNARKEEG